MATYFGFAISSTMFESDNSDDFITITRKVLDPQSAFFKDLIKGAQSCVNPSHSATISAIKSRFGIEIEIPKSPPTICLGDGDIIVVAQISGLPRLTDRHEYSDSEIQGAEIKFIRYKVSVLTMEMKRRMESDYMEMFG